MTKKIILVYITNPNQDEAKELAKTLIEKKLIACANLFPISSLYTWNDELEEDSEVVLIGKTTADKYDTLVKTTTDYHSYDVPCILKVDAEANDAYGHWLLKQLK